jgi:L-amino acid N-acyltransferase YncA
VSGAPVAVRPAAADDFDAIHAIYRHHVLTGLASFEEAPPERDELVRRHGDVRARQLPYLVALRGDRLVGYAYASPFRTRIAYRFTVEDSIYLAPDAVGQGIGRTLLAEVIERCTALGMRQMIAVIGDSGNAASIALHRALGFASPLVLHSVGFKFGRWVDSVMMQRRLGPGDTTLPPSGA